MSALFREQNYRPYIEWARAQLMEFWKSYQLENPYKIAVDYEESWSMIARWLENLYIDANDGEGTLNSVLVLGVGYGTFPVFARKLTGAKIVAVDSCKLPAEIPNKFEFDYHDSLHVMTTLQQLAKTGVKFDALVMLDALSHSNVSPQSLLSEAKNLLEDHANVLLTEKAAESHGRSYQHFTSFEDFETRPAKDRPPLVGQCAFTMARPEIDKVLKDCDVRITRFGMTMTAGGAHYNFGT